MKKKSVVTKAKSPVKTKTLAKKSVKAPAMEDAAKGRKIQAVKRAVRKVPKKKVSVVVLVVLAMASVVTVAWLFDKV